jgi:hypothetical protein
LLFDQADNDIVWISGTVSNFVVTASGSGGVLVCCLSGGALNGPFGIDLDANGNPFVASFNNNEIVVLNRNQSFSTFASGGGLGGPRRAGGGRVGDRRAAK